MESDYPLVQIAEIQNGREPHRSKLEADQEFGRREKKEEDGQKCQPYWVTNSLDNKEVGTKRHQTWRNSIDPGETAAFAFARRILEVVEGVESPFADESHRPPNEPSVAMPTSSTTTTTITTTAILGQHNPAVSCSH